LVGGNWDADDTAPRSISIAYWKKVCPSSERRIVYTDEIKASVRDAPGAQVFEHAVKFLRELPARCVEIKASKSDPFPQLYDLWLVGNDRVNTLNEAFLQTATSRLLGPGPVVASAIERNKYLFLPRGPRNVEAPVNVFQRMMAVHIRRGDFAPACKDRADYSSTYYNWSVAFCPYALSHHRAE
jgi:hypothetical protein